MRAFLKRYAKWLGVLGLLILLGIAAKTFFCGCPHSDVEPSIERDGANLTTEERIGLLHRLAANPDNPELTGYYPDELFIRTCAEAGLQHYDALAEIYRTIPNSPRFLLPAISTLYLRREVEKLKANPPPKITFLSVEPDLQLQPIPPPLLAAHRLALSVIEPFRTKTKGPSISLSYYENHQQWSHLITEFFQNDKGAKAEDFLAYVWGIPCGTLAESFYGPRSLMIFLSLVSEGRHSEAVGAALFLQDGYENYPNEFIQAVRSYLEILGISPGEAALGMLTHQEFHQRRSLFETPNLLLQLAAEGAPREAQLLMELIRTTPPEAHRKYIITLGGLISPNSPDDVLVEGFSSPPEPRPRLKPATKGIQIEILNFFNEFASSKTSPEALEALVSLLGDLKRPEGIPILLKLTNDSVVGKKAAEALVRFER